MLNNACPLHTPGSSFSFPATATTTTRAPPGGEIYVDESKAFFTALGDRYAQPEHMEDAGVLRAGKAAYKALKSKDSSYKISMVGARCAVSEQRCAFDIFGRRGGERDKRALATAQTATQS